MADGMFLIFKNAFIWEGWTIFEWDVTFGPSFVWFWRIFPLVDRHKHVKARIANFHGQSERDVCIHTNQLEILGGLKPTLFWELFPDMDFQIVKRRQQSVVWNQVWLAEIVQG